MVLAMLAGAWATGCVDALDNTEIRSFAIAIVQEDLADEIDPGIRAQATEAAIEVFGEEGRLVLREQLKDPHPAVRFAAAMALGQHRDRTASERFVELTGDPDASVRVSACFALERIGETGFRRTWADLLLRHEDPQVRRNAALAFGRLEDARVIPLLRRASIEDDDEGVRLQAREALALLGEQDAIDRFIHDAYGGTGFRQPFALLTLGQVNDTRVIPTLRRGLDNAPYREARLAAARSLGMKGRDDGFRLAVRSLTWNAPETNLPDDPPANQIMRVRSMAAMALGEIGDPDALEPLFRAMLDDPNRRVQLAAATAILKILNAAEAGRNTDNADR